jgi:hypothetical protein
MDDQYETNTAISEDEGNPKNPFFDIEGELAEISRTVH